MAEDKKVVVNNNTTINTVKMKPSKASKTGKFFLSNFGNLLTLMAIIFIVFYVLNVNFANNLGSIRFFDSRVAIDSDGDGIAEVYQEEGAFGSFLSGLDTLGGVGSIVLGKITNKVDSMTQIDYIELESLPSFDVYDRYVLFKFQLTFINIEFIFGLEENANMKTFEGVHFLYCSDSGVYKIYNRKNTSPVFEIYSTNAPYPNGFYMEISKFMFNINGVNLRRTDLSYEQVLNFVNP